MRNPNGYGSIHKLGGKRRKPWRVRKTTGWVIDEKTEKARQEYITIGYYETQAEARAALADYNKNPYDIATASIKFSEVYKMWSDEHFKEIVPSAVRTWKSAYNHSKPLWDMKMKDIKVIHLERTISEANVGDDTKKRMKSMYNLIYKFALKHEIVTVDYAQLCNKVKKTTESKPRIPFAEKEIQLLWDNLDFPFVDMILIGIYSGWRPQELATLKTENIDLEKGTMLGGLKTEAGKNRYVPIHSKILPLVEKRYNPDNKMLFTSPDSKNGTEMTYYKYREHFNKVMEFLKLNHTPHEARHTFITMAKSANVDEYCLKLIVGHSIGDITERIYTHRKIEELKAEIEKIQ